MIFFVYSYGQCKKLILNMQLKLQQALDEPSTVKLLKGKHCCILTLCFQLNCKDHVTVSVNYFLEKLP